MMKLYQTSHFNELFFFLNFGFSSTFSGLPFNEAWPIVTAALRDFEQKRATSRGSILSNEAFDLTFNYVQFLYDWVYAKVKVPVDHGPDMSSPRSWFRSLFGANFYPVTLPDSCTYERWAKEGLCSGDFDGFSKLFGVDAKIRVSVKSCGADTTPSVQALCIGSACDAVLGRPKRCSATTECPTGLICGPLTDFFGKQNGFDPVFLASIIETSKQYFLNDTNEAKNAGYQYYMKDLEYFLNLLGANGAGPGMCQVNWTRIVEPGTYFWDDGLYPTSIMRQWVREAISFFPYPGISLNWFSAWLNSK